MRRCCRSWPRPDRHATRLDLAAELAKGGDGRGFRAAAELLGSAVRRARRAQGGQSRPAWSCSRASAALLDGLADGLGLDQWVAVWDKLSALAGQVDAAQSRPRPGAAAGRPGDLRRGARAELTLA